MQTKVPGSKVMSPASIWFILLAACLKESVTQLVRLGRCPDLTAKQQFSLQKYLGTWYQRASFGTALFQGMGRCVTASYSANTATGGVDVFNKQLPLSDGTMSRGSLRGTAVLQDPDKMEGKLLVTFPIPVLGSITSPYWVLDTDYTSWALVYSCVDLRLAHITSGWILTRVQDMENPLSRTAVEEQVASALKSAGLSRSLFTDTEQHNRANRLLAQEN